VTGSFEDDLARAGAESAKASEFEAKRIAATSAYGAWVADASHDVCEYAKRFAAHAVENGPAPAEAARRKRVSTIASFAGGFTSIRTYPRGWHVLNGMFIVGIAGALHQVVEVKRKGHESWHDTTPFTFPPLPQAPQQWPDGRPIPITGSARLLAASDPDGPDLQVHFEDVDALSWSLSLRKELIALAASGGKHFSGSGRGLS
jgi:hypothetical protein